MPKIQLKNSNKSPHIVDLRQESLSTTKGVKKWSRVISKPVVFSEPIEAKTDQTATPIRHIQNAPKSSEININSKLVIKKQILLGIYSFCTTVGKCVYKFSLLFFRPAKLFAHLASNTPSKTKPAKTKKADILLPNLSQTEHKTLIIPSTITFSPIKSALRLSAALTAIVLLLQGMYVFALTENVKNKVFISLSSGVENILNAGQATAEKNYPTAIRSFSSARNNFLSARSELSSIDSFLFELAKVSPSQQLKLAGNSQAILSAAQSAAALGQDFSLAVSTMTTNTSTGTSTSSDDFLLKLKAVNRYAKSGVEKSQQLARDLYSINPESLPKEYQEQFIFIQSKSQMLYSSLVELAALSDAANLFAGIEQDKRYLLIFQNNAEARATGGFFGSFALIDFSKGKIKKIETPGGGSYDTEGGLREKIIAPPPLQLVNAQWHFWDSNWWPDWTVSAKNIASFYEKSGGPTVDGVISFTPTLMEDLLRIVGPIDMTRDYGVIINADNFWLTTQHFSEQKPDVTNQPKKIIGDLMDQLLTEIPKRIDKNSSVQLLSMIEENLLEKQILLYFTNDELQKTIAGFGWDGRLKETNYDYLSVVNSSVGGGKSDRTMRQTIKHNSVLQPDGSIINEVHIIREHTAGNRDIFTGVRNVDWLRVYVPLGSKLIESSGFNFPDQKYFDQPDPTWNHDPKLFAEEQATIDPISQTKIYEESGKTVFANWSMIDPGQTANIYFKYRLPFTIQKQIKSETWLDRMDKYMGWTSPEFYPYSFLAQKQAGSINTKLISTFSIQSPTKSLPLFKVAKSYPNISSPTSTGWEIEKPLDMDYYQAIFLSDN